VHSYQARLYKITQRSILDIDQSETRIKELNYVQLLKEINYGILITNFNFRCSYVVKKKNRCSIQKSQVRIIPDYTGNEVS
jgi:hypothetical protein